MKLASAQIVALLLATLFYSTAYCQRVDFDPREGTIDGVKDAIISKRNTCREVTLSFLSRIQHLNKLVNAIISLNPYVLDQAEAIDTRVAKGNVTGPLLCCPILLKDSYDTADMPTTGGSLALAQSRPSEDAPVVQALRRAGALILGKANLHELQIEGLSVSSLGGQTANPYDFTRTPGGSSGGSGAAVAMSFAVWATGSDTMNSLRSPASANSLFSIRSTRGALKREGIIPVSRTQDVIGPIARSATDLCLALVAMATAGPDEDCERCDQTSSIAAFDCETLLQKGSLNGLRLGRVEGFFNRAESNETTPVNNAMESTLSMLEKAGVTIVRIDNPIYDSSAIRATCDTQTHEFREGLEQYLRRPSLAGHHPLSFGEIFAGGEFLVVPSGRDFIRNVTVKSTSNSTYEEVLERGRQLATTLTETFEQHSLDFLIYPEQSSLVVPIGSSAQTQRNGLLAAITGHPAVAIPVGFSPATADAPLGVPIGMELLGRKWSEERLLQMAYQIEQRTHARRAPVPASERIEVGSLDALPRLEPDRSTIHSAYPVGVL